MSVSNGLVPRLRGDSRGNHIAHRVNRCRYLGSAIGGPLAVAAPPLAERQVERSPEEQKSQHGQRHESTARVSGHRGGQRSRLGIDGTIEAEPTRRSTSPPSVTGGGHGFAEG